MYSVGRGGIGDNIERKEEENSKKGIQTVKSKN